MAESGLFVTEMQPKTRERSGAHTRQIGIALALGLIVLLGAFLRFYKLGAYSIGNAYYAATVQSTLTSWHNFFFVSFEPGGSVTVDKPPLGFWVQAASAYVFGVNGFALAFPQALAGVLSILLLYVMVKRSFGAWAGLVAALALAITPVAVSTERNNTVDGLLLFVLLLAAWAFSRAVRSGRYRFLLLGTFLIGLGFNIKMMQAFLPLPALYGLYLFGAPHRWWKRIVHLAGATILLIAVSLSWAVIVDLTPPEKRPFIGSSQTNSVLELIVGHNGVSRLGLQRLLSPGGQSPAGSNDPCQVPPAARQPGQSGPFPSEPFPQPSGRQPGVVPSGPLGSVPRSENPPQPPSGPGGSVTLQTGGSNEVGQPGWLRLFTAPLVTEASWLLPVALLGIPLVVAVIGWRWPLGEKHLSLLLWAGWLLPELVYFTFNSGLFHAYYLIMLGPPVAALVGGTAWALAQVWGKRPGLGWVLAALIAGGTVAFQVVTVRAWPGYVGWVTVASLSLLALGLAAMALVRCVQRRFWGGRAALGIVLAGTMIAPLLWSGLTTWNTNPDVWLPRAGLHTIDRDRRTELSAEQEKVLDYLLKHTEPDSYLVATLSATDAAPYILETQRPVLTFGGFNGGDDVVDVGELAQMVKEGELRFVLAGQELAHRKPEISGWLNDYCRVVSVPGRSRSLDVLYDCDDAG